MELLRGSNPNLFAELDEMPAGEFYNDQTSVQFFEDKMSMPI